MARKPVPKLPVTVEIDAFDTVPRNPARPPDRLRYEAKAIYTTHPDGVTLEELSRDPRFAGVSLDTLTRWSAEDGWVEARKQILSAFGESIGKALQKQLYSRIARVRIRQLKTVRKLQKNLTTKALDAEVKSAEGAAKALRELLAYEIELSTNVAAELSPQGSGAGSIEPRNALTDDEVLDAARGVLRQRRRAVGHAGATKLEVVPAPRELGPGGDDGA